MRCDMNALALKVEEGLLRAPHGGELFFFRGCRGDLVQNLLPDGHGMSLDAKWRGRGRFIRPLSTNRVISISASQLGDLLDVIDWRNPRHRWRTRGAGGVWGLGKRARRATNATLQKRFAYDAGHACQARRHRRTPSAGPSLHRRGRSCPRARPRLARGDADRPAEARDRPAAPGASPPGHRSNGPPHRPARAGTGGNRGKGDRRGRARRSGTCCAEGGRVVPPAPGAQARSRSAAARARALSGQSRCPCCSCDQHAKRGEAIPWIAERVLAHWKIVQPMREKFTCRECEGITQPPAPFHATTQGWAGPSLNASTCARNSDSTSRSTKRSRASPARAWK